MSRRIPSLDGVRAVAILLVLLGHSGYGLPGIVVNVLARLEVSRVGVSLFFVLSGYLITRLLVEEQERDGSISLKSFYVRRFFRIVPAYYLYLTCMLIAGRLGYAVIPRSGILPAYLFIWNYSPQADGWFFAHSWSLSMEEQFYLLWPPILGFLGRKRAIRVAAGIILVAPLSRVLTYAAFPAHRGQIAAMLHSHGDVLMFGAIAAMGSGQDWFERRVSWLFARGGHAAAGVVLLVSTAVGHVLRGSYMLPVGMSVEGVCIAVLILWLIRNPASAAGRVLNGRPLVFVGSISYSLYLWQQAFLHADTFGYSFPLPVSLPLSVLAALISYRLVEVPCLRVRDLVLARFQRKVPIVA